MKVVQVDDCEENGKSLKVALSLKFLVAHPDLDFLLNNFGVILIGKATHHLDYQASFGIRLPVFLSFENGNL